MLKVHYNPLAGGQETNIYKPWSNKQACYFGKFFCLYFNVFGETLDEDKYQLHSLPPDEHVCQQTSFEAIIKVEKLRKKAQNYPTNFPFIIGF